jgi:putative glutathione S-transferase
MARVLAWPGVRDTVDIDHVVAGYYSIKALNPSGIRPTIPEHVLALLA